MPTNSPAKNNSSLVIAKGDSAATYNYWREEYQHCLTSMQQDKPWHVILPDAETVQPSNRDQLPLSSQL